MSKVTEQERERDEKLYGPVSKRNRGLLRITTTLLTQLLSGQGVPLPRMSRVVKVRGKHGFVTLVVESPDISPPGEDGTLPTVNIESELRYLPKERFVPLLPMINYMAVAGWEGKPETRVATLWTEGSGISDALLAETACYKEEPSDRVHVYAALRELGWAGMMSTTRGTFTTWERASFTTWEQAVGSLDEQGAKNLLATMLKAYWGNVGNSEKTKEDV